jgi:NADPH:quinone reductase-like Zn-dependent oxidoreductase
VTAQRQCSKALTFRANSSDQLLKLMGMTTGHSKVPGCDFSGVIHSVGKDSRWSAGDEVCGVYMSSAGML